MTEVLKSYWNTAFLVITTYPWTRTSLGSCAVLAFMLIILILGIQFTLGIIFGIVALVVGICVRFHSDNHHKSAVGLIRKTRRVSLEGFKKTSSPSSPAREPRQKMDMRITGSALIDETIHEMIDYILRDYIHSWHDHITQDDEFVHELRLTIQETLVTLSSRVKEIDWIPYITTALVDDAASHLRLFRQSTAKVKENPLGNDLISVFFDLEASMEKNLCRDMVCTDDSHLNDYFQGLIEGLLYLLLPQETYGCTPVGSLAQDLLANHVLIPLLNLLSDPDFVNQTIVWLCQDFAVTPEIFMSVIRTTDTMDELESALSFFKQQINEVKKAEASNSDDVNTIKQQLRCLGYVKKAIDHQQSHLKEGGNRDWTDEPDSEEWQHYFTQGFKLHTLSLEEVIKNSIALSYFLDYMSSVGGNHYLLMYLNADAWRQSAEMQLQEIELSNRNTQNGKDQNKNIEDMLKCMRDAAFNVYDQFLSEKAAPRVKLPENITKKFYVQIRTEAITADLFDQIQEAILEKLQTTEKFYPAFTRNKLYIKCLMELDLLKAETVSAHSQSSTSDDEDEDGLDGVVHVTNDGEIDESKSFKTKAVDINDLQTCRECLKQRKQSSGVPEDELLRWEKDALENKYKLRAEIIEVALTVEKGNTFGIYVVKATRQDYNKVTNSPEEKEWHIYRRYSDFYDWHHWIKSKWVRLSKLEFPSKQTFGKTDRIFLEKRMAALNKYFSSILSITCEPYFGEALQDSLLHFLESGNYVPRKKQFSEKIDSLVNMTVNPLKQSVKNVTHAVKTMPENLYNTVDVFTKIFQSKAAVTDFSESMKVGASIDQEADDNIPLRIILLLMDEVFDLKSRNQWLRRRIVVIIRQVIKAMMGDNLNRRIVDYVAYLTSPVRVSGYLRTLQHSLWPGGRKISPQATRDFETKSKTRIAAKASLLSSLSDELKHLIGSETTRRGLLCVFDMCQNPVLNRRFLLVLIEGILKTLYADKPFPNLIQRLHYRSSRVGKHRPFILPNHPVQLSNSSLKTSTISMANLSPRGSRKRKS